MTEAAAKNYNRFKEHNGMENYLLEDMSNMTEEDIELYFSKYLEFGTAGLRGVMTAGTAAMNIYTVAHATQALADCILASDRFLGRPVVVGYDCRHHNLDFAHATASVLAANKIPVLLFDELRPTPVVSFAIRHLGCIAGINITASHNPSEYNGYKVYWEDGAQLPPEKAEKVSASMKKRDLFDDVQICDFEAALADGRIKLIGHDVEEAYIAAVLAERVNPDYITECAGDLKIVYTPLHGAGYRIIPEVLRRSGVQYLYTVPLQSQPDGSFPTLQKPNPEYPASFELGINLAQQKNSDIVIATDPDSDRTGAAVRCSDGEFRVLTGNQIGALLIDYIINAHLHRGDLPKDSYVVKTIVTTELATAICNHYGVKIYNVLTGFKYIGEVIGEHEKTGEGTFLFGYEESYGFLKGTYTRDKDAVVTTMLLCEMAAFYRKRGMTLYDALTSLFKKYGYHYEETTEIYFKGVSGPDKMADIMSDLRNNPPIELGGERIVEFRDYLTDRVLDIDSGNVTTTGLPASNVLFFISDKGNTAVIRPSGTEPKIKVYILANGSSAGEAYDVVRRYKKVTETWVDEA